MFTPLDGEGDYGGDGCEVSILYSAHISENSMKSRNVLINLSHYCPIKNHKVRWANQVKFMVKGHSRFPCHCLGVAWDKVDVSLGHHPITLSLCLTCFNMSHRIILHLIFLLLKLFLKMSRGDKSLRWLVPEPYVSLTLPTVDVLELTCVRQTPFHLLHSEGTSKVSCKCDFSKVSDYNGGLWEINFFPENNLNHFS